MKRWLILLFLCVSPSAFSQLRDTLGAQKFWEDNIANIVSLNKKKIIEQTHFPLVISFENKLTKEQFEKSLEIYLNPEVRDELSKMVILDIDAWAMPDDPNQMYMLVCYNGIQDYDALIIGFLQYNGKWMLSRLDYQRD